MSPNGAPASDFPAPASPSDAATEMTVSIVVPTHRRPQFLERALRSLLLLDYPPHLLDITIVATPGDGADEVVQSLAATSAIRVRCIHNPPDQSTSASLKRNLGVKATAGRWIAFIDDDCVADPGWITAASALFDNPRVGGIEGRTAIPPTDPPTLTYKGMQIFTRPGGFQTCNVFYRREIFERIGGFDPTFPFYLEDSDLAWSVLDAGFTIPYATDAVVTHPVSPAAPWRVLADARRAVLLPYLFKKHPKQFLASGIRALGMGHLAYLLCYALVIAAAALGFGSLALAGLAALLILLVLHNVKLFAGCRVSLHEWAVMNFLLPLVPVVRLFQLLRGNARHGVFLWR